MKKKMTGATALVYFFTWFIFNCLSALGYMFYYLDFSLL